VTIEVQISANASRNQIIGWVGGRLKIKVKAPAVEGKANAELLRYLAEVADTRPGKLRILRGDTSKTKLIEIDGVTLEEFNARVGSQKP
jgi:uncharacterized protein (TIGR00251 family)